jgi:hypothetical protein
MREGPAFPKEAAFKRNVSLEILSLHLSRQVNMLQINSLNQ